MKADFTILVDELLETDWLEILSITHYEAPMDAKLTRTNLKSVIPPAEAQVVQYNFSELKVLNIVS
jgi:hypothetical protein